MAQFRLHDFIDVGTHGYIDATSWQVAKDPDFKEIIDQSLHDTVNIYTWNSPLPDDAGWFYADLDNLYARVKVHILESESDWYVMEPKNQNDQEFVITENGEVVKRVNSLEAGIR